MIVYIYDYIWVDYIFLIIYIYMIVYWASWVLGSLIGDIEYLSLMRKGDGSMMINE